MESATYGCGWTSSVPPGRGISGILEVPGLKQTGPSLVCVGDRDAGSAAGTAPDVDNGIGIGGSACGHRGRGGAGPIGVHTGTCTSPLCGLLGVVLRRCPGNADDPMAPDGMAPGGRGPYFGFGPDGPHRVWPHLRSSRCCVRRRGQSYHPPAAFTGRFRICWWFVLDRFAGMLGLAGYGALVLWVVWKWGKARGIGRNPLAFAFPLWVAAVGGSLGWRRWSSLRRPAIRSAAERGRIRMRDGWNALRDRPRLLGLAALLSIAGNLMVAGTPGVWPRECVSRRGSLGQGVVDSSADRIGRRVSPHRGRAGARRVPPPLPMEFGGDCAPVAVAACLVTLAANLFWAGIGGLLIGAPSAEPTNLREAFEHDA